MRSDELKQLGVCLAQLSQDGLQQSRVLLHHETKSVELRIVTKKIENILSSLAAFSKTCLKKIVMFFPFFLRTFSCCCSGLSRSIGGFKQIERVACRRRSSSSRSRVSRSGRLARSGHRSRTHVGDVSRHQILNSTIGIVERSTKSLKT
jgi:hypothetical protein